MHHLALLARQRRRLGTVPLELPTTINLTQIELPSDSVLPALLTELKDAQIESSNLQIPGFSSQDARSLILQVVSSGGIDPKEFLGKFFATGAAVVCSAAASPALAPLCAKGGQVIGEVVAGLQATPSGPTNTAASDALTSMMSADSIMLKDTRDKLLYNLAARFNSEPEAMEKVKKIVDDFYPSSTPLCATEQKASNGVCPDDLLGPYLGGFTIPFFTTNACALIGVAYSDACRPDLYDLWEWHMDYSSPVIGKQNYPLAPGWVEKLFSVIEQGLQKRGIDLSSAFQLIREDNQKKAPQGGRWYLGFASNAEAMLRVYNDLRSVVWPALEIALQKRLQGVVVEAAVKANVRLLKGTIALTNELARRQGCEGGDCRKTLQAQAVEVARNLETEDIKAVQSKIETAFPEKNQEAPSPWRPVVALGGAIALVYALHRLIKRYV